MKHVRLLLIDAVLVWVLIASPSLAGIHVDAAAAQRLKAGDVLVDVEPDATGEADGHIAAAIDIEAAPSAVFAVMTDCARALKFVDNLTVCKVLERARDGSFDVREHHSRWLSILPEMVSVFRSDYVPNREIRFSRISGDLKFLQGTWTLQPMSDGKVTRLLYDVRVGLDMPLPAFMIRGALESDVPRLLKSLRAEVMKGR